MKAAWLRRSLRSKLVLSFVLVFTIPVVITLVFAFSYTAGEARRAALDELQDMNDTKALQIEQYIADRLERVEMISHAAELKEFIQGIEMVRGDPTSKDREDRYQDMTSEYGLAVKQLFVQAGFTRIAVLERDQGSLLFDHNLDYRDIGRRLQKDSFDDQQLLNMSNRVRTSGLMTVWDASRPGSLEGSIIYYGMPLYDREGSFTHVLVAGHSMEKVNMMVSLDYGGFTTRDTFLVNSNSVILSEPRHPSGDVVLGSKTSHEMVTEALRNFPDRNTQTFQVGDVRMQGSYSPIRISHLDVVQDNINWVLVSQLEQWEIQQDLYQQFAVILVVVLLAGIGVFFLARVLARGIAGPIAEVTAGMKRLAAGELTFTYKSSREDEIGEMVRSAGEMVQQLKHIVGSLRGSVNTASSVGSTISSSVEQQSAISVEQAGSISEISSTMDEFTASFGQVSESVSSVSRLSDGIYQKITESAGLIDSVSQKIRDINEDNDRDIDHIMELKSKSKDITKIMEIINSISDQTKIISFNAALEASSAGEAGKRFGVVAAEIRKLTEDVIQSTSHIDALISEIQALSDKMVLGSEKTTKNIRQGLDSSEDSVENVENIVESIKKSNESTKQIVLAVQQQQTAASQIQSGLKELSEGARQNSEAIQAINESGNEFQEVTGSLEVIIHHFKTEES